jgi:hypothetical protein
MNCRTVQRELSAGSELSQAVCRHVEGCNDCRRFADDLRVFWSLGDSTLETPSLLKEVTLEKCRAVLAERASTRGVSFWRRHRRLWSSPRFVAAVAILGVLIVGTVAVTQIDDSQDRDAVLLVKIFIAQIILQNLVTALFMPAILILKKRASNRPLYKHS